MIRRFSAISFILPILFLFAISAAPQSPADRKVSPTLIVTAPGRWQSIDKGLEFRRLTLERSEAHYFIDLKLLRFNPRWIAPRVLHSSQFQLNGADARTFVEKSNAIAAINANYFDINGKPLAFLKIGGKVINPRISRSPLYSGVFGIKDRKPFIAHRDDFQAERADEATQSGPLLLLRGATQTITGVPARASRRALIGIDKERRLIIAATDNFVGGLFWNELQEIFLAARWRVQALDLLALDGGGSAQFYVKVKTFEEFVPGTSEVPVAIGFFNTAKD